MTMLHRFSLRFCAYKRPLISHARLSSFTGAYMGEVLGIEIWVPRFKKTIKLLPTRNPTNLRRAAPLKQCLVLGKAWKRLFLGYEFTTGFNNGRVKKNNASLETIGTLDLQPALGLPCKGGYHALFGVGFEYKQMDLKPIPQAISTTTLAPLVGLSLLWMIPGDFVPKDLINSVWKPQSSCFPQIQKQATALFSRDLLFLARRYLAQPNWGFSPQKEQRGVFVKEHPNHLR